MVSAISLIACTCDGEQLSGFMYLANSENFHAAKLTG